MIDLTVSACKDLFHFLLKITDLSNRRLTNCACSRVIKPSKTLDVKQPDIRVLLQRTNTLEAAENLTLSKRRKLNDEESNSGLDLKHVPVIKPPSVPTPKLVHMKTRTHDIIREHDRGKKRKLIQLKLFESRSSYRKV